MRILNVFYFLLELGMRLSCNFVNVYTKLVNVYTNMAVGNKTQMVLSWFSVMITTSWLVTDAASANVSYRGSEPSVKFIRHRLHHCLHIVCVCVCACVCV